MDRIRVSEALDTGSIPVGGANIFSRMAHWSRDVSGIHTGMQAQRSVRVPGLFRASLSNIHASQRLVLHLQRTT